MTAPNSNWKFLPWPFAGSLAKLNAAGLWRDVTLIVTRGAHSP